MTLVEKAEMDYLRNKIEALEYKVQLLEKALQNKQEQVKALRNKKDKHETN